MSLEIVNFHLFHLKAIHVCHSKENTSQKRNYIFKIITIHVVAIIIIGQIHVGRVSIAFGRTGVVATHTTTHQRKKLVLIPCQR